MLIRISLTILIGLQINSAAVAAEKMEGEHITCKEKFEKFAPLKTTPLNFPLGHKFGIPSELEQYPETIDFDRDGRHERVLIANQKRYLLPGDQKYTVLILVSPQHKAFDTNSEENFGSLFIPNSRMPKDTPATFERLYFDDFLQRFSIENEKPIDTPWPSINFRNYFVEKGILAENDVSKFHIPSTTLVEIGLAQSEYIVRISTSNLPMSTEKFEFLAVYAGNLNFRFLCGRRK